MDKPASQNGPIIILIGMLMIAASYFLWLLPLIIVAQNSPDPNIIAAGSPLSYFAYFPVMVGGILVMLHGCFSTWLNYRVLTAGRRKLIIGTIITAVVLLVIGAGMYTTYLAPAKSNYQAVDCSQKYESVNAGEGSDEYYKCLESGDPGSVL